MPAAPSFRVGAINEGGTTSHPNVNFASNSGLVSGDLVIIAIAPVDAGSTVTGAPAGTTFIRSDGRVWLYWAFATSSTGQDFGPFTTNSSLGWVAAAVAYSGANSTTPVRSSSGAWYTGSASSTVAPSSAGFTNAQLLTIFAADMSQTATWTPPAGETQRAHSPATNLADFVLDINDELSDPTLNPAKTATQSATSSNYRSGQQVVLNPPNLAPYAPTLNSPVGNMNVDRTITQRFSWTFSDPDVGDTQSKYDLQYRVASTTPWTALTGQTPNTYRNIAGGTFSAAQYEWQVRTYDAQGVVGPWSTSGFFNAIDPPVGPTITAPTSGGTVSTPTATVSWSVPNQDAYQLRTVAADGTTVVYDSGTVTSSARSQSVPFATNNVTEHIQVRVQYQSLWTAYADITVSVAYTAPATPTVLLAPDNATSSIQVTAVNPTPTGTQPTVTTMDVYRRVTATGGAGIRIAAGVGAGKPYVDYTPAAATEYDYQVVVYGTTGTTAASTWTN